ncbi:basic salivary proline-rich protein 2-like [Falco cherrug]|uniref:basic salivary proline-rich protein 2-like n=1 Tax=Falco cherrug TaxID=345164 RepID=UPI002478EB31|nr:basic salivary proline-rich protein 2-like [Falco cherrug]
MPRKETRAAEKPVRFPHQADPAAPFRRCLRRPLAARPPAATRVPRPQTHRPSGAPRPRPPQPCHSPCPGASPPGSGASREVAPLPAESLQSPRRRPPKPPARRGPPRVRSSGVQHRGAVPRGRDGGGTPRAAGAPPGRPGHPQGGRGTPRAAGAPPGRPGQPGPQRAPAGRKEARQPHRRPGGSPSGGRSPRVPPGPGRSAGAQPQPGQPREVLTGALRPRPRQSRPRYRQRPPPSNRRPAAQPRMRGRPTAAPFESQRPLGRAAARPRGAEGAPPGTEPVPRGGAGPGQALTGSTESPPRAPAPNGGRSSRRNSPRSGKPRGRRTSDSGPGAQERALCQPLLRHRRTTRAR